MAKEIAIQMTIDTSNAESNLVLVEDSLSDIDNSLKKISTKKPFRSVEDGLNNIESRLKKIGGGGKVLFGLEFQLDKLNKITSESSLTWGEMGKAIEQYQNIALAAGKESPIGQEAIRRAAEMKQEVDLLTQSVDAASKKGQSLQASMQLASTVIAGYGVFQGVQAAMGVESEKLKETFIKLQAAQTALVSIEQIRMALSKESFLMIKGKVLWTKAETFATGLLTKAKMSDTAATISAVMATKAFSAAMIATGIGALVVGLGMLISHFGGVKEAMFGVSDFIYKTFKPQIDVVLDALRFFGVLEEDAAETSKKASEKKAAAAKKAAKEYIEAIEAEEKALKETTNAKVAEIDFEIAKRNAAGKDVSDLEREKIELLIEVTKKEIDLANQRNASRIKELEIIAMMNGHVGDMARERLAEIEAEGLALQDSLTGYTQQLEIFEIKQTKIRRDAAAKNKKFEEEAFQEKYERRALENILLEEQEIASTKKTNEELLKIYQDNQEKIKKQREQDLQDELNANLAKIDSVEQYASAAGSITGSLFEMTNNLGKKGEAAEEKRAKRQFGVEKLLGITEAAINTAKGIVKYTASGNLPMVGVMAATGAAQIAAIASKKFQPSGGSGGGGSVSSATSSITSGSVSDSGGVEGSGGTQTTNTEDITNQSGGMQTVLVLDSLTKVQAKQNKIDTLSSI